MEPSSLSRWVPVSALTDNEIAIVILSTNWGPTNGFVQFLDTAIAVCRAESGGDPNKDNPTSSAKGLWQILLSAHPEVDAFRVHDALYNTQQAQNIYNRAGGWKPWQSYNTGKYKRYTGHGAAAYNAVKHMSKGELENSLQTIQAKGTPGKQATTPGNGNIVSSAVFGALPTAIGSVGNPVKSIPDAITAFTGVIVQGAKTVGVFMLAVVILILGIVLILKDTSVGKKVSSSLGSAAKMAAIL